VRIFLKAWCTSTKITWWHLINFNLASAVWRRYARQWMQHFSEPINYIIFLWEWQMAKNLPLCETGFGVYRSAQLTPHPFFLLLHLFSNHTLEEFSTDVCWLFTNNEVCIYLWHCFCKSWSFLAVNVKIGIIQKLTIFFSCEFHKCVLWINCEL
jgi:hypothetical protein